MDQPLLPETDDSLDYAYSPVQAGSDDQDLLDQKAVDKQLAHEGHRNGGGAGGFRTKIQCYSVCGKPGHNVLTCKEATELSDSSIFDSAVKVS